MADVVLISQSIYYKAVNARRLRREAQRGGHNGGGGRRRSSGLTDGSEDEPLLARRRSSSIGGGGLPGSHRRHSVRTEESGGIGPLKRIITGEDETPDGNPWLHNTLSLLAVYAVGTTGWFISWRAGVWDAVPGAPDPDGDAAEQAVAISGLVLGYVSALCYLWYVSFRLSTTVPRLDGSG